MSNYKLNYSVGAYETKVTGRILTVIDTFDGADLELHIEDVDKLIRILELTKKAYYNCLKESLR
jgi:hypothetical protein